MFKVWKWQEIFKKTSVDKVSANLAFQFYLKSFNLMARPICLYRRLLKIKPKLSTINVFPRNEMPASHISINDVLWICIRKYLSPFSDSDTFNEFWSCPIRGLLIHSDIVDNWGGTSERKLSDVRQEQKFPCEASFFLSQFPCASDFLFPYLRYLAVLYHSTQTFANLKAFFVVAFDTAKWEQYRLRSVSRIKW